MNDSAQVCRRPPSFLAFVALLPAFALVALFARTCVDAPLADDVDALLRFANRSAEAEGFGEQLTLLFERHVDHRLVAARLAARAELAVLGRVDFRWLAALGVGALIGLAAMIPRLRPIGAARAGVLGLAPVAWLLLQPQAYDALLSPTMGANLVVLAFAALTFVALRRPGPWGLVAAAAAALAAQFTQGNGVLVLPAGLAALVLAGRRRDAWIWLLISLGLALLYAVGFASRSGLAGLEPAHWGRTAVYALTLLGSALGFGEAAVSLAAGACVLAVLAIAAWRGEPRRHPWLWGLLLFTLLSIAANAVGRGGIGIGYAAGQSRYRVYSALVLVLTHLIVLDRVRGVRARRIYVTAALVSSIVFGIASYAVYAPRALLLAESAARGLARWSATGQGLVHPRARRADAILARSRALGTFPIRPPLLAPFLDRRARRALPADSHLVDVRRFEVRGDADFRVLEGSLGAGGIDRERALAFTVVEDASGAHLFTARVLASRRPGRSGDLGFRSILPTSLLPLVPLGYGLLVVDGEREAYVRMDRKPDTGGS